MNAPAAKFSVTPQSIADVLLIKPRRFGDARGWFSETFSASAYAEFGVKAEFVQDNHSLSAAPGVIRGLHFQTPPSAQAKLVRVVRGSVFDVAVDLRRSSPTYGQWCGATLTASGGEQYFVPRGFAHGFCTLEPDTEFVYKVDGYYAPECDAGLRYDDPDLGIAWPVPEGGATVSDKDAKLPFFRDFQSPFA
ncbi:MAG: dTDP-4-dehydrorhamnose 3,5-epimerase [Beijerinckiaceae bacterium]|nr:dTDP-4-dehydrorhamnose 3,5-epimerase [Beijerinckiaceae bacterium]